MTTVPVIGIADVAWRRLQHGVRPPRELLGRTRFPTPEPVALGEPGAGYPLPWSVQTCFRRSKRFLNVPRLRNMWGVLWELPRGTTGDVMTHGDLIPSNVLVAAGHLAGVIDVGGLGPAEPALDLVSAWHLLDAGPRQVLRDELACDDLEWERGKAWAFEQAMGAVWYYTDSNPAMSRMGRRTLERIMADTSAG